MFKNFIFVVFIMGIFFGCSNKNMPDYSSKQYDNVDKDAILNAAKRVILLADKDYLIHSSRNEIEATKTVAKYKGFNVNIHINTIDFKAVEEDNITKAKLKLTVQDDYFSSKPEVIKNNAHELFWNRLEYILGLNEDWHSCTQHRLGLNFDGIFCNIQYNDNKVPSKATILTNITITEPQLISNDENISLVTIDLSVLESIKLPLVNVEQNESEVSIADINTSGLFDLGEVENNETNISIEIIDDLNTSFEENNITEDEHEARLEEERIAKEKEATEAERLAKEKAEKEAKAKKEAEKKVAEAKRLEEERLAQEKAEAEAKAKKEAEEKARLEAEKIKALEETRKLQERLEKEKAEKEAKKKAAEAKRLEEERLAKEKAETEAKAKKEAEEKARLEAEKIKALEEARKLKERLAKEKAEAEAKAKKEAEEKARLEAEKIKALEEARKLQKKLEEERKAKKVEEERQKALEEIRKLQEKIKAKEASSD